MSNREWFELWMASIALVLMVHGVFIDSPTYAASGLPFAAIAAISMRMRLKKGQHNG